MSKKCFFLLIALVLLSSCAAPRSVLEAGNQPTEMGHISVPSSEEVVYMDTPEHVI